MMPTARNIINTEVWRGSKIPMKPDRGRKVRDDFAAPSHENDLVTDAYGNRVDPKTGQVDEVYCGDEADNPAALPARTVYL